MKAEAVLSGPERGDRVLQVMRRLLARKGVERFVILTGDEEASRVLPGGIYPYSGLLLADNGNVFSFWVDWDESAGDYTLGDNSNRWRQVHSSEVQAIPSLRETFLRARRKLAQAQRTPLDG